MNKDFVPYEQALALKELGFDEPCIKYYVRQNLNADYSHSILKLKQENFINGECLAPLYQQAFRFFREEHGYYYPIHKTINNTNQVLYSIGFFAGDYLTYEEAELACLRKLIEIVKKRTNEILY